MLISYKKHLYYIFTIFVVTAVCCKQKHLTPGLHVHFKGDSTIGDEYDSNSVLKYEVVTVKNGKPISYKSFYPNGKISSLTSWWDDTSYYYIMDYYPNGFLKDSNLFSNRKKYLGSIYYHSTGKTEKYKTSDRFGDLFYVCCFDSLGYISEEKGRIIDRNYIYLQRNLDSLKIGEEVKIEFIVAEPPGRSTYLTFINQKPNRENIPDSTFPVKNYDFYYTRKFKQPGVYLIKVLATMKDIQGHIANKDSLTVKYTVIDK